MITVSGPVTDVNDTLVGVLGLDIRFEDVRRSRMSRLTKTTGKLTVPTRCGPRAGHTHRRRLFR